MTKKIVLGFIGLVVTLILLVILAGMYKFNYLANQPGYSVDGNKISVADYTSCAEAGGAIGESYPQQCFWEDKIFVEDTIVDENNIELVKDPISQIDTTLDLSVLVGMTEKQAQDFATKNNRSFRVIEKDGEAYAVTLDYRVGRISAGVANGVVTKYTVEGSENETPKEPLESVSDFRAEIFTGAFESYNTACYADGECYATVDGKKVTTVIGWSRDTVGSFANPDIPVGTQVEVYAQKLSDNTYTLYGSREYYVREVVN